jgi:alginate O-acetyltransferase complex protein AlgI
VIFTQLEFFIFFAGVVGLLHLVAGNTGRKVLLLGASYYFYAYWDYRFLSLLIGSTLVDYVVGRGLGGAARPRTRQLLLSLSLAANLGALFFFKYFNFFVSSCNRALSFLHVDLSTMSLVLPVGISFYTFEKLSYVLDVYRGRLRPCRSLLDFAVLVAFFPRLVAGPIVRPAEFLPQLARTTRLSGENFVLGLRLLVLGLFKKVFIADRLALFVNPVFENYAVYDAPTLWLAVAAYSLQIYCDFAGYSDMAIGAARIMGYELPTNFQFPYLARNMQDFWRRWHISLSRWIRDYVYIPLGGSRGTMGRIALNTMVTMFLCGLWHGAAWTFVAWGLFHGAALVLHRGFTADERSDRARSQVRTALARVGGRPLTLLTIAVGWILFRSETFGQAASILYRMFTLAGGTPWLHPFVVGMLAAAVLFHLVVQWDIKALACVHLPAQAWYTPAALLSLLWLVLVFHAQEFHPFIYFQF